MEKIELKKDQTIIFDGDSATHRRTGAGLGDWPYLRMMNWNRNWADIFAELMFCWKPELNLTMRNVAIGGAKTYEILERFDEFIKPHNPDWVFVTIGGNDLAVKLTLEESLENISKYIKKVQDECGGNVIYLTHFKAGPHSPGWKVKIPPDRIERSAAFEKNIKDCGAFTMDVGTGLLEKSEELVKQWEGHTIYSNADRHFNNIGNTIIAGEVMKRLGYVN